GRLGGEYPCSSVGRCESPLFPPPRGRPDPRSHTYDPLRNITIAGRHAVTYLSSRPHLVNTVGPNTYQSDANGLVIERSGPAIPGGTQTIQYTPFDLPRTITSGGVPTH